MKERLALGAVDEEVLHLALSLYVGGKTRTSSAYNATGLELFG